MFFVRGFVFPGLRRLPAKCLTSRIPSARYFSVSAYRQAAEISKAQTEALEALKSSEAFQKISKSPAALSAIQKLTEVMQNSGPFLFSFAKVILKYATGIDPGTKPTTLQMLKLATNSEFREASKSVVQELQNAGVDLTSKVFIAMQLEILPSSQFHRMSWKNYNPLQMR
jgi:hypothetical protein